MTKNKGITLIALVVTIIVLIILAAVSINLILRENGLMHRAREARFKTQFRDVEEKVALYKADKDTDAIITGNKLTIIDKLPLGYEITDITSVEGYTEHLKSEIEEISGKNVEDVKLYYIDKEGISTTQKHTYIIDIDTLQIYDIEGEEFFSVWHHTLEKLTGSNNGGTDVGDSDGEDPTDPENPDEDEPYTIVEEIPVPKGFYYVGGTKETGIVISDDIDDENKYRNQTTVGTDLEGNQFVWVPVEGMDYDYARYVFLQQQPRVQWDSYTDSLAIRNNSTKTSGGTSDWYTEEMPNLGTMTELENVTKYGGYYIGRYEVGIEGYDSDILTENTEREINWTGYSNGRAVIQEGKQVWNHITSKKAKEIAENMYATMNNVTSRLCSGYAWDTALKFIEINNEQYSEISPQGNYIDTTFSYTDLNGITKNKSIDKSVLVPTGQTTAVNNIYDMAGNVMEYTTEKKGGFLMALRGGDCGDTYYNHGIVRNGTPRSYSAGGRASAGSEANNGLYYGFRITLFLK